MASDVRRLWFCSWVLGRGHRPTQTALHKAAGDDICLCTTSAPAELRAAGLRGWGGGGVTRIGQGSTMQIAGIRDLHESGMSRQQGDDPRQNFTSSVDLSSGLLDVSKICTGTPSGVLSGGSFVVGRTRTGVSGNDSVAAAVMREVFPTPSSPMTQTRTGGLVPTIPR